MLCFKAENRIPFTQQSLMKAIENGWHRMFYEVFLLKRGFSMSMKGLATCTAEKKSVFILIFPNLNVWKLLPPPLQHDWCPWRERAFVKHQ